MIPTPRRITPIAPRDMAPHAAHHGAEASKLHAHHHGEEEQGDDED